MKPNPQRKFDSMAGFYSSLGRCPRIDVDDLAVVSGLVGSMALGARCLAEEFEDSGAFDMFSIDGSLYESKPGTGLRESSVIHGARPPAQPREPPPPLPQYRLPAMPIPDDPPKKRGRPPKVVKTKVVRVRVIKLETYRPPVNTQYTQEAMRSIREFLIPKWIKDGRSEQEISDPLRSAWPAQLVDPILKEFFPVKEWPFTHA